MPATVLCIARDENMQFYVVYLVDNMIRLYRGTQTSLLTPTEPLPDDISASQDVTIQALRLIQDTFPSAGQRLVACDDEFDMVITNGGAMLTNRPNRTLTSVNASTDTPQRTPRQRRPHHGTRPASRWRR